MKTIRISYTWKALLVLAIIACTACNRRQTAESEPTETETTAPKHLTADDFAQLVADYALPMEQWTYRGTRPAVVDFYADWCGPCRQVAPLLDELAEEYAERVTVYKVNVDDEPELATALGIDGIPALLFVSAKQQPTLLVGARPKEDLKQAFETLLTN